MKMDCTGKKYLEVETVGEYVEVYNNFKYYKEVLEFKQMTNHPELWDVKNILLSIIRDRKIVLKRKDGGKLTKPQLKNIYYNCNVLDLDTDLSFDRTELNIYKIWLDDEYKLNYNVTKPEIKTF